MGEAILDIAVETCMSLYRRDNSNQSFTFFLAYSSHVNQYPLLRQI